MNKAKLIISLLATLGAMASPSAHAYLDPGTGSLIIQGIIGGIAAASITIKLYWHKIKLWFRGEKQPELEPAENRGEEE